jgi:hypothetical protein
MFYDEVVVAVKKRPVGEHEKQYNQRKDNHYPGQHHPDPESRFFSDILFSLK